VGVLEADEPRADGVHVVGLDRPFEVRDVEDAVLAGDRPHVTPLSAAGPAGFPQHDVCGLLNDRLVAGAAVDANRDLVPHGTGGNEEAASMPKKSAMRASSSFTVGSSPKTSSPTRAATMAASMPGDGRVTVSLRRSIMMSVFAVGDHGIAAGGGGAGGASGAFSST